VGELTLILLESAGAGKWRLDLYEDYYGRGRMDKDRCC